MSKIYLTALLLCALPLSAQNIKNGENLYKKCITCHGADGMGKKSQQAPMIAGQYDWYIESQIIAVQKKERDNANAKKMYPFVKNLKAEEIKDLAAYIAQMPVKKTK